MSDTHTPTTPTLPPIEPADLAQFWRQVVVDFSASGMSVRAFCLDRGLHEKRFFTWRKKLGLSPVARPTPPADAPPRTFVPVRVVADTAAEITMPGGVAVRVPVTADPACVARLVAALRGATC